MSSNPDEQLREWYTIFLTFLRNEYSKLSEEEKRQLELNYDCSSPLQVEVFWLANPNWQFIVTTHFEDRSDLEITINGPYDSTVFQKKVEEAINNPKWDRPLYSKKNRLSTESPETYSEFIAERLHGLVESAKNMMFMDFPDSNRILIESIKLKNGLVEHVFGDIRRFDPKLHVKKMINDAREQIEHRKKWKKQPIQKENPKKSQKGFGTYFLPPILLGKIPKPSVTDRLHGATRGRISVWDKKEFDVIFKKTPVIIRNDGFVGVYTPNKKLAIEILNTIMATAEIEGLTSIAVRDHELIEIEYDKETQKITGYAYDQNIERNRSMLNSPDTIVSADTREVEQSKMEQIVNRASVVFVNSDFATSIRNYIDMLSHLKDSEYSQAFLSGWSIIEQYISEKWNGENIYSNKPRKHFTVDRMLRDLKTSMSSQQYSIFMTLKKIRNDHMHKHQSITEKQAETCLDKSREIIMKKYNTLVERLHRKE